MVLIIFFNYSEILTYLHTIITWCIFNIAVQAAEIFYKVETDF